MPHNAIVSIMFVIFAGAAILSTITLFSRQSLLIAYIALGMLMGPDGLGFVASDAQILQVGEIGIIFLLFLLGLELEPVNLWRMLKKATWITFLSSFIFASISATISYLCGFDWMMSIIIGLTMVFSSTIISLKLLPTNMLHHQHIGEIMISILLLQDFIALFLLIFFNTVKSDHGFVFKDILLTCFSLPGLILFGYLFDRFILFPLFKRFEETQEYIFLIAIAWCLAMGEFSEWLGLSHAIGAFIAGITIASHPIALYIVESLKPLRDFFLILFFFSIGAEFEWTGLPQIWLPATLIAICMLLFKPGVFSVFLKIAKERTSIANETGVRLGQASEFSLLIGQIAYTSQFINQRAFSLIQTATLITFIISCYWVNFHYPTPMAMHKKKNSIY